jgi:hypothetical protein
VSWTGDGLRATEVASIVDVVSAVGGADDSVHVVSHTGRVRSYDAAGGWTGEVVTDVEFGVTVAAADDGRIAIGGIGSAAVVDPATGSVVPVAGVGNVAGLEFTRDGDLLVVLEQSGDVGLWDTTTGTEIGPLWVSTGPVTMSQPWYDAERDTVWVAIDGRLVELRLDPDEWISEACAFVGRDLTSAEWDEYVPGDAPQQPVCS